MNPVEVICGSSPVILAMPHTGLFVPDEIRAGFNEVGQALSDTDWHIHRLYAGLLDDVTSVRAIFHRYVIDPNRDPSGQSLYPGKTPRAFVRSQILKMFLFIAMAVHQMLSKLSNAARRFMRLIMLL